MPHVTFTLNGKPAACDVDGKEILVDTLRWRFGLTGTKKACGTGDCGACTVLVGGLAVRSCTYLTCMADGKEVTTIEGVGEPSRLHPVQQAFIDVNAAQCGYCIPGMVLTACAFLKANPDPAEEEVREAISGNLCRCTGYQKIVEAVLLAAGRMNGKTGRAPDNQ